MPMNNDFSMKVGIITGAADGIGAATCKLLAQRGAALAMVDLDFDKLCVLKDNIESLGSNSIALEGDVSNESDVSRAVDATLREFGSIHFLVNNAGIMKVTSFLNITPDEWDKVLSVNLRGSYLFCRAVLPIMISQGKGVIVNVSSQAGRSTSTIGGAHYTASKAGLLGLTRHLAFEMGPIGVRVNAFCPGPTLTPLVTRRRTQEQIANISKTIPLRRYATPKEQASVIAFLLSEESSYIAGASIDSNGGIYMF